VCRAAAHNSQHAPALVSHTLSRPTASTRDTAHTHSISRVPWCCATPSNAASPCCHDRGRRAFCGGGATGKQTRDLHSIQPRTLSPALASILHTQPYRHWHRHRHTGTGPARSHAGATAIPPTRTPHTTAGYAPTARWRCHAARHTAGCPWDRPPPLHVHVLGRRSNIGSEHSEVVKQATWPFS
jgi:hypothetical protein